MGRGLKYRWQDLFSFHRTDEQVALADNNYSIRRPYRLTPIVEVTSDGEVSYLQPMLSKAELRFIQFGVSKSHVFAAWGDGFWRSPGVICDETFNGVWRSGAIGYQRRIENRETGRIENRETGHRKSRNRTLPPTTRWSIGSGGRSRAS